MSDPIVLTYRDSVLRASDVRLLEQGAWLNDAIVSWYFEYLSDAVIPSELKEKIVLLPPSLVMLIRFGVPLGDVRMNTCSYLFLPLNDATGKESGVAGSHWTLLVYVRETNTFLFYDSYSSGITGARELARLSRGYIQADGDPMFVVCPCPQQINSSDCGCHVLANTHELVRCIIEDRALDVSMMTPSVITPDFRNQLKDVVAELQAR